MNSFHEVVTIFVGQAGTQVSNACWELLCLEHGIQPDGFFNRANESLERSCCVFFEPLQRTFSPRTIMVDLEPTVIDEVRIGPYRNLFNPRSLITGKEDAANNFARGFHSIDRQIKDTILDRVRIMCENCSNLNGFIISRAVGGGTGSGLTTLLLEYLNEDYAKKTKLDFAIYPAPNISTAIVEPYNAILATHHILDYKDCCFVIDNEALYDICRKLEVQSPMYTNLNRVQAQVFSNITASLRINDSVNCNLQEIQTNLVPYPRIHFPLVAFAPIITPEKGQYNLTIRNITYDCFQPANQMLRCDPRKGAYIACNLLYRGDVNVFDVKDAIAFLKDKKSIRFVDWCKNCYKITINRHPVVTIPGGDLANKKQTVTSLCNNTIIRHAWTRLLRKFDLMYQKKAFFHHYLAEGMEEKDFQDARDNMCTLLEDYIQLET